MNGPEKHVFKWTRYQHKISEDKLLEKARILKLLRDKAKTLKNDPEILTLIESSTSNNNNNTRDGDGDGDNNSSSVDQIPEEQQRTNNIEFFNIVPSSDSEDDDDDVVILRVERNHNHGIQQLVEISSDQYDQSETDIQRAGNGNQNLDISNGDDIECISVSESESDESINSSESNSESEEESESEYSDFEDDLRYCKEGKGGSKNRSNRITKRIRKNVGNEEDEEEEEDTEMGNVYNICCKKRKYEEILHNNKKNGKKGRFIDENSLKSYVKKKQFHGEKPYSSSAIGLSCVDAIELSDENELGNFAQKGCNKSRNSMKKKTCNKRENHQLKDMDNFVQKGCNKRGNSMKRKFNKRENHQLKDMDELMNRLAGSIWDKDDELKDNKQVRDELKNNLLPPSIEFKDKDKNKRVLPLKFRFTDDDDDRIPVEKDEEQEEIDNLFAKLELSWIEDDVGCTKSSKENNDDTVVKEVEKCNHSLILDETIGLICKYCGIVMQEIKDCLPDLRERRKKRNEWFDFYEDETFLPFEFQFDHEECSISKYHSSFVDTDGPIVNIIPAYLRRQMYPHQLEGFEFLWNKIAGSNLIEDLKKTTANPQLPDDDQGGNGCIISHAPGTGKSFLTIIFLMTFMEIYPNCHPVIIAPVTMLHAWATELKRWKVNIPFHNLQDKELSVEEQSMADSIINLQQCGKQDKNFKRMMKLCLWSKSRSILGIGYKLFGKLAGDGDQNKSRRNIQSENFRKILLEFPGILILDEGHTARNENSMLWKTLTKVQTGRRVILSGTPFQNNHTELYNILCLVNPNFAKQKLDKNDSQASEQLRDMMAPFVHVHKGNVLQEKLPGLRDTLVVLKPTDLQKQLVDRIHVPSQNEENKKFLEQVRRVSLVTVHPSLVSHLKEFSDHKLILDEQEMNPDLGVKTRFVIEIVRLSNARDEKVLIFGEFIPPLNYLLKQLTYYFEWEEGKQVLYMDGKLCDKQRQMAIGALNAQKSEAKVLLASIKACSEGINLVGASRVILLDTVWNPSFERQAICRAYRLGQKKIVYVYHLISTKIECEKYLKQAKKNQLSEILFPSTNGGHNHNSKLSDDCGKVSGTGGGSDDDILDTMVHSKKLGHIFEIPPRPNESKVFENFDFIFEEK